MDQKTQFIADYLRSTPCISELCELYGISRKTGYKWIERYLAQGPQGLDERSRKPRRSPNRTPDNICDALLDVRRHAALRCRFL
jgi:transposase-like protein